MPVLKRVGILSHIKLFFLFRIKKDEENKAKQNDFIPLGHPV